MYRAPAAAASRPVSQTVERKTRERAISTLAWRRAEWVAVAASVLLVVSIGLLAALPYAFLALGLRHVRNLFGAVREAISELQTTV